MIPTSPQVQGGRLLAEVKQQLVNSAKPGTDLESIEALATKLLNQTGGQPSFKMVPGYHWSTCININSGIVHGIPKGTLKSGDLVTIDVGLYFKGYHTDTSTSFIVGSAPDTTRHFLQAGIDTLPLAIDQARPGNHVWDISNAIQESIEAAGYQVVRDLTGHGVGKKLHQNPAIPCFTSGSRTNTPVLTQGQALAIEVMYVQGDWHTVTAPDRWTISTRDGNLSAVFEETIILTADKPLVVTAITT